MFSSTAENQVFQVTSDAMLQRHDLMIELYRLDQAAQQAQHQARTSDVARIDHARRRVSEVLSRLPA